MEAPASPDPPAVDVLPVVFPVLEDAPVCEGDVAPADVLLWLLLLTDAPVPVIPDEPLTLPLPDESDEADAPCPSVPDPHASNCMAVTTPK
jgi:hypothetical protein